MNTILYTWDVVWDECSEEESQRIECTERSVVRGVLSVLRYSETDKEENRSPTGTHGNTWSAGDHLRKSSLVGSISSSIPTWPSGEMGHGWDMENEFIELGFFTWKPSPLNSISMFCPHQFLVNRVCWTRIVRNEISLKRWLTYNIVWVL